MRQTRLGDVGSTSGHSWARPERVRTNAALRRPTRLQSSSTGWKLPLGAGGLSFSCSYIFRILTSGLVDYSRATFFLLNGTFKDKVALVTGSGRGNWQTHADKNRRIPLRRYGTPDDRAKFVLLG